MAYRFLIVADGDGYSAKFVSDNKVLFTSGPVADKVAVRQAVHALQSYAAAAEIKDES